MTEIVAIFKELFSRIASFFDVFDLSFFISGGLGLLALRALLAVLGVEPPSPPSDLVAFVVVVLLAYVLGLLFFAAGRHMRRKRYAWLPETPREPTLSALLEAHGLAGEPELQRYAVERPKVRPENTLYPLLWAELRQNEELQPSFKLINSYWVRAAIFDGLLPALICWIGVIVVALALHGRPAPGATEVLPPLVGRVGGVAIAVPTLLALAVGCLWSMREAQRSDQYQREELVATLRWWRNQPRPAPAAAPALPAGKSGAGEEG